jgi:hypothetical protein
MILMARGIGNLLDADVTLVEPDMKGRLELCEAEGIEFRRISTRNPPHDLVFHVEYVRAMNEIYREIQPDVLVVFNAAVLAPLLLNAHRPKCVIYYMLESIDHQLAVGGQHFFDLNRMASKLIDLVVVPERRRYAVDAARLGWQDKPVLEVLNIGSDVTPRMSIPDRCRFLFAGTLNKHTCLDWLSDDRLAHLDIDIAGPCDSQESRDLVADFLSRASGDAQRRYLGLMSHTDLLKCLEDYAYRLVFWNASDINTLYASPNKYFESISHCLPPIATPHPQMLEINRLYRCSLLSSNFSQEAVVDAMLDAERIFYSDGYLRLLKGCVAASFDALQWSAQFARVGQFLRKIFPGGPEARSEGETKTSMACEQTRVERLWRNSRPSRVVREDDEQGAPGSAPAGSTPSVESTAESVPSSTPADGIVVDVEWYLRAYPDVRALGMGAQEHFDWIGKKLGRAPNPDAHGSGSRRVN